MNKGQDSWLDVCLLNLVVFLAACMGMGIDDGRFLAETPEYIGLSAEAARDKWVTLWRYQRLENRMVKLLGHVSKLTEAGWYSGALEFALVASGKKALAIYTGVARPFTTPIMAVMEIPITNFVYNANKLFHVVLATPTRAIVQMEYRKNEDGVARTAFDDCRSLLYWMRGFLESIPTLWYWRKKHRDPRSKEYRPGFVWYRVVPVDPMALVKAEASEIEARIDRDAKAFLVNGEKYGKLVWLKGKSQEFLEQFTGESYDYSDLRNDELPMAVLMEQDLVTPGEFSDQTGTLMRKNELYICEPETAPGIRTTIEMRWNANPVARFVMWLLLGAMKRQVKSGLRQAMDRETARARENASRYRRAQVDEHLENSFLGHVVVLSIDRTGSRVAKQEARAAGGPKHPTPLVLSEIAGMFREFGGWPKDDGDGWLAFFSPRIPPPDHDEQVPWTIEACAEAAAKAALVVQRRVREYGWGVRIGGQAGPAVIYHKSIVIDGKRVHLDAIDADDVEDGSAGPDDPLTIADAVTAQQRQTEDEIWVEIPVYMWDLPHLEFEAAVQATAVERGLTKVGDITKILDDRKGSRVLFRVDRFDRGAGRIGFEDVLLALLETSSDPDVRSSFVDTRGMPRSIKGKDRRPIRISTFTPQPSESEEDQADAELPIARRGRRERVHVPAAILPRRGN